ncbi:MAG: ammonium transporter [Deltaproteobacteria bacterium]|jgi:Amt family ammonium transporter|nr:ammonium transporter [Deltaproteobacteria bacterium]
MEFSGLNTLWVLLGAVLVFFMQAGFVMVETGFTRAKNAGNIIMKNFIDYALGAPLYWLFGFGIMFGGGGALFGGFDFMASGDYSAVLPSGVPLPAFLIFQTVFCGTAATIVSGAMAERTKFEAYCLYSIAIALFIYPVSGHWIWGGGWLSGLGFHDFAGSTAVHLVGGAAAFVGAKILGPRMGKYNEDGSPNAIPGHSLTLGALGVFILWVGWFGFNGASTVSMEGDSIVAAGNIFVTTNLAAAVSTLTTMLFTWVRYKKADVSMTLNGALAGLVAITAGCDAVSPAGAALIGMAAGVVLVLGIEFIDRVLKVDDPVGAIGVHGVCGALGTALTGLFSLEGGLFYGHGPALLGVQILGVLAVTLWVAAIMTLVFLLIKATVGLRVSAETEFRGLDLVEHGLASSYADFMPVSAGGAVWANHAAEAATPQEILHRGQAKAFSLDEDKSDAVFTRVSILFNPVRLDAMKKAMSAIGITGMTVKNVLGCGMQRGTPQTDYYRGAKLETMDLLPKLQMDIIVTAVPVERVIETAQRVLHTGRIGDGKIFVSNVQNVVKISTGERGYAALQDLVEPAEKA